MKTKLGKCIEWAHLSVRYLLLGGCFTCTDAFGYNNTFHLSTSIALHTYDLCAAPNTMLKQAKKTGMK